MLDLYYKQWARSADHQFAQAVFPPHGTLFASPQ
jgi:hypothetical protein